MTGTPASTKLAERVVLAALLLAIAATFACSIAMSRAGCPACMEEFASNGVKPDGLALQLPSDGDELQATLRMGKPYARPLRDVYEKQTSIDDIFLWLYPAQFVLACLYLALTTESMMSRLLFLAASLAIIATGWFDHQENVFIHAILADSGKHFKQLAHDVTRVSSGKWLLFGVASFFAATGLARRINHGNSRGLTVGATTFLCAALVCATSLVILAWALRNRNIVGWSAVAFSIFPASLLWLLYLKPWAVSADAWLRSRLGKPRVK